MVLPDSPAYLQFRAVRCRNMKLRTLMIERVKKGRHVPSRSALAVMQEASEVGDARMSTTV